MGRARQAPSEQDMINTAGAVGAAAASAAYSHMAGSSNQSQQNNQQPQGNSSSPVIVMQPTLSATPPVATVAAPVAPTPSPSPMSNPGYGRSRYPVPPGARGYPRTGLSGRMPGDEDLYEDDDEPLHPAVRGMPISGMPRRGAPPIRLSSGQDEARDAKVEASKVMSKIPDNERSNAIFRFTCKRKGKQKPPTIQLGEYPAIGEDWRNKIKAEVAAKGGPGLYEGRCCTTEGALVQGEKPWAFDITEEQAREYGWVPPDSIDSEGSSVAQKEGSNETAIVAMKPLLTDAEIEERESKAKLNLKKIEIEAAKLDVELQSIRHGSRTDTTKPAIDPEIIKELEESRAAARAAALQVQKIQDESKKKEDEDRLKLTFATELSSTKSAYEASIVKAKAELDAEKAKHDAEKSKHELELKTIKENADKRIDDLRAEMNRKIDDKPSTSPAEYVKAILEVLAPIGAALSPILVAKLSQKDPAPQDPIKTFTAMAEVMRNAQPPPPQPIPQPAQPDMLTLIKAVRDLMPAPPPPPPPPPVSDPFATADRVMTYAKTMAEMNGSNNRNNGSNSFQSLREGIEDLRALGVPIQMGGPEAPEPPPPPSAMSEMAKIGMAALPAMVPAIGAAIQGVVTAKAKAESDLLQSRVLADMAQRRRQRPPQRPGVRPAQQNVRPQPARPASLQPVPKPPAQRPAQAPAGPPTPVPAAPVQPVQTKPSGAVAPAPQVAVSQFDVPPDNESSDYGLPTVNVPVIMEAAPGYVPMENIKQRLAQPKPVIPTDDIPMRQKEQASPVANNQTLAEELNGGLPTPKSWGNLCGFINKSIKEGQSPDVVVGFMTTNFSKCLNLMSVTVGGKKSSDLDTMLQNLEHDGGAYGSIIRELASTITQEPGVTWTNQFLTLLNKR